MYMNTLPYKKIYFIGIGGIGMSALARYFHFHKVQVAGSDLGLSDICIALQKEGMTVYGSQNADNIPEDVDCIVYTLAIPQTNPELIEAKKRGVPMFTYAEMLGKISENSFTVAVAGTHGKTTTTGMIASTLKAAGKNPNVIVGSLLVEGRSNFVSGTDNMFVVEACEYKRSFLNLHPNIVVITNIEEDHLDYYRDLADIQSAFIELCQKLPTDGKIICDTSAPNLAPIVAAFPDKVVNYADFLKQVPGLRAFGAHNIKNGAATLAVAHALSLDMVRASEGLANFRGSWRRLEFKKKLAGGAMLYDDYGHHPTEILVTLDALHGKFTDKKIFVVFQPHLYSRTKSFFNEFAEVFAQKTDHVIMMPIYAAREIDDGSITSAMLVDKINSDGGRAENLLNTNYLIEKVAHLDDSWIVLLLGAGDAFLLADVLR
jgi:UDP-N-acetylmuramate--alanine ligase